MASAAIYTSCWCVIQQIYSKACNQAWRATTESGTQIEEKYNEPKSSVKHGHIAQILAEMVNSQPHTTASHHTTNPIIAQRRATLSPADLEGQTDIPTGHINHAHQQSVSYVLALSVFFQHRVNHRQMSSISWCGPPCLAQRLVDIRLAD